MSNYEDHILLDYFKYSHLPQSLQEVSKPFCELAKLLDRTLPEGTELDMSLRKLLEAKDCAVRASLPKTHKAFSNTGSSA